MPTLITRGGMSAGAFGFAGIVAVATLKWNSADKNVSISLSNSDRTMTGSAGSARSARGTPQKTTGKWYFEYVPTFGANGMVGIANASATLADFVGMDANGYGLLNDGSVYNAGGVVTNSSAFGSGAVVQVAVDYGTNKLWFGVNNTFDGNPGAGTGGIGAVASGLGYPMGSLFGAGNTAVISGAGFTTYTPPSGFTAWG